MAIPCESPLTPPLPMELVQGPAQPGVWDLCRAAAWLRMYEGGSYNQ